VARRPSTLVLVLVALAGCRAADTASPPAPAAPATTTRAVPDLNATLWLQQGAEAKALTTQCYALARLRLDEALADPTWTAAEEQTGDFGSLPPAVILDVDETVLDNSYYEARGLQDGTGFDPKTWTAWCNEAKAPAIAGAREFCTYAHDKGVTVFYVTNRKEVEKDGTRRDLEAQGFPLDPTVDTLRCRADVSDKGPRRAAIAAKYRVLLLVGDSATDFSSTFGKKDIPTRLQLANEKADRWGVRWIVLPNPMYGDWENGPEGEDEAAYELRILRRTP
jgi:acid phosphatase